MVNEKKSLTDNERKWWEHTPPRPPLKFKLHQIARTYLYWQDSASVKWGKTIGELYPGKFMKMYLT